MASRMKQMETGTTDADAVMLFIEGAGLANVIKAACRLELFDALVSGPKSAAQIAAGKDWDLKSLGGLLSTCAAMKLVEKQKLQGGTYSYSLLGRGRTLLKNEKGMPTLWEMAVGGGMSGHMGDFEKMVKKEIEEKPKGHGHGHGHGHEHGPGHGHGHSHGHEHGHDHGEGDSDSGMWEGMPLDIFRMMDGVGRGHMDALVKFVDLSNYKTAVDVGAGSGVLGAALCHAYPDMHVTLLDGEETLKKAKENFVPKDIEDRISYLAGDALEVDLPTVDLFVVSQVLHHIPKEKWNSFLSRMRDHLNPGGGLFLLETVLNENKDGKLLGMLWFASHGERFGESPTATDFVNLMENNGFKDVQIVRTQEMCFYDLVFARKA